MLILNIGVLFVFFFNWAVKISVRFPLQNFGVDSFFLYIDIRSVNSYEEFHLLLLAAPLYFSFHYSFSM